MIRLSVAPQPTFTPLRPLPHARGRQDDGHPDDGERRDGQTGRDQTWLLITTGPAWASLAVRPSIENEAPMGLRTPFL
jgi:hypothetical protein